MPITMIDTISTNEDPPDFRSIGIKKTPKTAPNLPIEAEIPVPCPLTFTG